MSGDGHYADAASGVNLETILCTSSTQARDTQAYTSRTNVIWPPKQGLSVSTRRLMFSNICLSIQKFERLGGHLGEMFLYTKL